ncbi:phytoene desaturase [Rossellomorea vietnamensis]|uniref:4,4'-diaponeurosporene oxygenase n=1 Tax=Rossellomorea vietnamensis TaxID=218284 RepID=A0A5D4MC00_9BACI|nr:phytoene desaturase family protein [Rossellomorea vietnamensis]TYR99141.1 phytoene desaturase [Rossellomorea vietnamensis]
MSKSAVVIGGGLGGLSTAISLASKGHKVTVFEKNERAGGKLNIRKGKGYSFDTGPSILTMPWVLENLFERAGRDVHDYLDIQRVEPQWRTFFEDGTALDVTSDIPTMLEQIRALSPEDASAFYEYLDYCGKMYDLNLKSFYKKSLSGLGDLRSLHNFKELMSMDPLKTMDQATKKHFKDKRIQQLFNFFIMYIGSSPYHAPAVLSQLIHVQLGLGIFYVQGGMYKIAEAMLKLCEELGVEVRTNSPVVEILTEGSTAKGVQLEDGTIAEADIVVSNLEALPAYKKLLQKHGQTKKTTESLEKFEPTVSGLVMLLGVDKQYDQLQHHNFFFSKNPEKEFKQIFDEGRPADDPTVYIGVSAKNDPGQAPAGKENLFILTHVPPLKEGESWETYRKDYRNLVLDKLERMGMEDIRSHIEFDYEFIPDDIQGLYGANGGSIYGVNTDKKKNGGFKIPARSTMLENMYFAGGSTHPGGGVPMVTLSGQLTADLIQEDLEAKGQKIG